MKTMSLEKPGDSLKFFATIWLIITFRSLSVFFRIETSFCMCFSAFWIFEDLDRKDKFKDVIRYCLHQLAHDPPF